MASPTPIAQGTPRSWRFGIAGAILLIVAVAYLTSGVLGTRGQAAFGYIAFFALAALCSHNLRQVRWQTIAWGIGLQFILALMVLKWDWVRAIFEVIGQGFKIMIACSDAGADFVFGSLAKVDGPSGFVFAFKALPPIIFVSAFFSVLYYYGVLQFFVRIFAKVMSYFMRTSGAETLAVSANVFMGQTEAPLIVKPYILGMTRSELLALMGSGMATISGGMMAIYISYGADEVAILCTSVMACPCALYLSKLILPETEEPKTMGNAKIDVPSEHPNAIAAAAAGVKDGLYLALNVAAMLIAFIAFIALFDAVIGGIKPQLIRAGMSKESLDWIPEKLRLQMIFGWLFAPVAFLMGVESGETQQVGSLLGMKLAANEHVAYLALKNDDSFKILSKDSKKLAVFALSGFANFASVGIQLGGIGAMAEERRGDLAKLGMRALFVGFLATVMNAAVAGMLMPRTGE